MHGGSRFAAPNLEAVLLAQGRKQRWLADRAGTTESLLSKLVVGKHTVDEALGERIADALGVPFSLLFELRDRSETYPSTERSA